MIIGKAQTASDLHPTSRKARKRLSRLADADVVRYGDNACSQVNRMLGEYVNTSEPLALDDAHTQALVLLASIETLLSRR
ncbi:hypothetical protein [Terracoccus sp. 273MFTsu3.1]|uniref:hypothetical protein n=1 Tax=Terracoccus sp. 273MFTsu3.1 TaxID=1172188 RepID=UPI000379814E|nr:hypothetical protein [Terracoccus sp. 273MFTsu3.1]